MCPPYEEDTTYHATDYNYRCIIPKMENQSETENAPSQSDPSAIELLMDVWQRLHSLKPLTDEQILGMIIIEARKAHIMDLVMGRLKRADTDASLWVNVHYDIFPLLAAKYKELGRFTFIKCHHFRTWWYRTMRDEATVADMPKR